MHNVIESKSNRIIKELKSLNEKKYRDQNDLFIADGLRFVNEIPSTVKIDKYIFSESFASKNNISAFISAEQYILSDKLFASISETKNPQGIIAVCHKQNYKLEEIIRSNGFYIICEEINDPGNLGTIIRTAHASGVNGIILSKGSVDLYNNKVLRSTMGSVFKIPIIQNADISTAVKLIHKHGIRIYAAHLKGNKLHYEPNYISGCAFMLGNEARGITDSSSALCDELIKIPMPGGAESLNASVAAAVLMYEVVRQRMIK